MENNTMVFALAGNPNCGKTTLFNSLTGSTAYVGNWPGVTVEKREGTYKNKEFGEAKIIDLPGIYSLSPYTPEEIISRNFILNEKPDCVINVIDATNLERNLYMTTQILEMNVPVVIALNMMDAVKANGQTIDAKALSKRLHVPVVPISALRYENLDTLMKEALSAASLKRDGVCCWNTGSERENIQKAVKIYQDANCENPLFHAIKALEGDELEEKDNRLAFAEVKKMDVSAEDFEATSADLRYKYITGSLSSCRTGAPVQESKKLSISDKIDKVLTNKWLAIPIMIVILFLVFHFTFSEDLFFIGKMGANFGEGYPGFISWVTNFVVDDSIEDIVESMTFTPFSGLFYSDGGIPSIGVFLANLWGAGNDAGIQGMICVGIKQALIALNSPEWLVSFVYDGVLNGISAVLGFVPQIMVLFFFFSILEDSGYMARIAFVLDRIFRRFGVSGRAFLPMIMGFGCGVPAMINTRTLSSDKERIKTIRVIPFFTCGAKAEFLAVIAAAIASAMGFPADLFTFLIYMLGVVLAIVLVIVMNQTTQREKVPPFIMELPSYHRPQLHALCLHVWDRGKHYIKKAFTIIFVSTVVIWFLSSFTPSWQFIPTVETLTDSDSILAHIGMIIAPLFTPMGFGNVQGGQFAWTYAVASIQGIVAKENVTAILSQLASLDSVKALSSGGEFIDLVNASNLTKTGALGIDNASLTAFAVFNMTTIPCFASVATAKGELGKGSAYKGTLVFWLATSYILGCLTYVCLEWLWTMAIIFPLIALGFVGLFFYNRRMNDKEARLAKASC